MWVSGSGLWGSTHHRRNSSLSFDSGDYVGVLLSLQENERKVYWYLNGAYTGNFLDLKEETRDCGPLSICYCIGDGAASITRTYLPDEYPPDVKKYVKK